MKEGEYNSNSISKGILKSVSFKYNNEAPLFEPSDHDSSSLSIVFKGDEDDFGKVGDFYYKSFQKQITRPLVFCILAESHHARD